jgi:hypothetical protein
MPSNIVAHLRSFGAHHPARSPCRSRGSMRRAVTWPSYFWGLVSGATILICLCADGFADDLCQGHRLLPNPRPATSCQKLIPQVYASPNGELQAVVLPAGVSLYATPDIESRVVIRSRNGDTLTSKDYSSPRGTNGYYVDQAKWTPDSQFFIFSMISSGGHSPWSFPTMVYSRKNNVIAKLSDMIGGRPIMSGDFSVSAPHTVRVTTWKREGDMDNRITVAVDLQEAFDKLPASAN